MGFVMDDERLKKTEERNYDEWLARIRAIRASETNIYRKVKDIYATADDYKKTSEQAQRFFKEVQNKMLWAVTGKTAPELIVERSDPSQANMGLTYSKDPIVKKSDIGTAKNYLKQDEIGELNGIVTRFLNYAEDQAKRRKVTRMRDWADKLDVFLKFDERDLLTHAGTITTEAAKKIAGERYDEFNAKRKKAKALAADKGSIKKPKTSRKKRTKRGQNVGGKNE